MADPCCRCAGLAGDPSPPTRERSERRTPGSSAATTTCIRHSPGACRRRRARRTTFTEILEQIWWRLDAALDLEMIRWSRPLGALEALERGTTSIVDHHASPNAIEGSLDVIHDACAEVGVRIVSLLRGDRSRRRRRRARPGWRRTSATSARSPTAQLRRRPRVSHAVGRDPRRGGGAGRRPRRRRAHPRGRGRPRRRRRRPPARRVGPTNAGCSRTPCTSTGPLPGTIVHNPRSNLNNAVGYARPDRFGTAVRLGTDGIGADMLEEFRLAFARLRADDVTATPETPWSWLAWDRRRGASRWIVRSPMEPWHLAYTPGVGPRSVRIDGEVVLRRRRARRRSTPEKCGPGPPSRPAACSPGCEPRCG